MKAWAKSFYLSAAWEKTRAAYLMSQDYICERCGQPAKIVHHKRWLNRENINDIHQTHCRCSTYRKMYVRILVQIWIFCKINSMKIRGTLTTRGK